MKVYEMNPLDFENELRELREDKNLTQVELSKIVHLSVSTLKNYERGICLPNTKDLINIAMALGIDEIRIDTSRAFKREDWIRR